MCGIAGIVGFDRNPAASPISRMVSALAHRGPDSEGCWSGMVSDRSVSLGFRRLAILDLSPAANQPMLSSCGRHLLIFNGEVYNYLELRDALRDEGVTFRTESDTEVVLQALVTWGEDALCRFNGMWGLAWLQLDRSRLLLSRDRLGVKPLYYTNNGGEFLFASEIKSILAGSDRRFRVNARVAQQFLDQSILDANDETFFQEIHAVPAGHVAEINISSYPESPPVFRRYWSLPDVSAEQADASASGIQSWTQRVRELFVDAVRLRLRSDVPVGVLLSGGVDSSSIAATMQRLLGKDADLHVMAAVSDDSRFSEETFIDRMAGHLSCQVHKLRLDFGPTEALRLVSEAVFFNDAPVGSFSSVAHLLLMQHAKRLGVTVILSGQGADELLCGYRKYIGFFLQSLMRTGQYARAAREARAFYRQGQLFEQFSFQDAKRYLPSFTRLNGRAIRGPALNGVSAPVELGLGSRDVSARQRRDLTELSVPSLVHYEDRMSMAHGREIRLPFLDYRFVELLNSMPVELKLRDGWTKWILRKALEPDLPPQIAWRRDKQGFVNPGGEWLKHGMRELVERVFSGDLLIAKVGLIDQAALLEQYRAYCRQPFGKGRISFWEVFNPLSTELWMRRFESHLQL